MLQNMKRKAYILLALMIAYIPFSAHAERACTDQEIKTFINRPGFNPANFQDCESAIVIQISKKETCSAYFKVHEKDAELVADNCKAPSIESDDFFHNVDPNGDPLLL